MQRTPRSHQREASPNPKNRRQTRDASTVVVTTMEKLKKQLAVATERATVLEQRSKMWAGDVTTLKKQLITLEKAKDRAKKKMDNINPL